MEKNKNYFERELVSWDEFENRYRPTTDHLHLAVLICLGWGNEKGTKKLDPILLVKNNELKKVVYKFPGTGFDKSLVKEDLNIKLEGLLDSFSFKKYQYLDLLDFYKEQESSDGRQFLGFDRDYFSTNNYMYYFQKIATISVLEKTGLLAYITSQPFYIDVDVNHEDTNAKVYRLFFEPRQIKAPEKNTARFFNTRKFTKKLPAERYISIINNLKIVNNLIYGRLPKDKQILKSYLPPLKRWLEMTL